MLKTARSINNKLLNRAKVQRLIWISGGLKRLHRRILISEPNNHKKLAIYLIKSLFKQAKKDYLKGHKDMRTWIEINYSDSWVKENQIFNYK